MLATHSSWIWEKQMNLMYRSTPSVSRTAPRRWAALVLCALTVLVAGSATAVAGADPPSSALATPVPVSPAPATSGLGGGSTHGGPVANATTAQNQYTCNDVGWAPIANEPGGYIIGLCAPGVVMYRSWISDPVSNNEGTFTYNGGYIPGNFNACGWIRSDRTSFEGLRGRTNCVDSASRAPADFAYYANCAPGACQDGSPVYINANCHTFGNVRPWVVNGPGYDESASGIGTSLVLWRYVTVDNRFMMVHIPGTTWWRFVSTSCLNDPAQLTTMNPYTVYWWH
ncbi:MAG TPA: hypothetical protein VGM33_22150 [Baekduia sp.]